MKGCQQKIYLASPFNLSVAVSSRQRMIHKQILIHSNKLRICIGQISCLMNQFYLCIQTRKIMFMSSAETTKNFSIKV